jgi:predicted amidophosphoribosyltransferase
MACRPLLDWVFPPQCAGCNAIGTALCPACAPRQIVGTSFASLRVTALGAYEGSLRAAILALKDGRRDVADALGRAVATLIARDSLIVPVPTTPRRRRVRGMDGVAVVAQRAAAIAHARVITGLELRRGDAQRGRSRSERLAAHGRFACDSASVAARRITLFDDVCTTGATLRDCADAVHEAGGIVEDAVVVAVTKTGLSWGSSVNR